MVALILSIALEVGIPPNFALAIALTENPKLDAVAINYNRNGTNDVGIMQLNSRWFAHIDREHPESNIRAACLYIKELSKLESNNTWWAVAISYNAGPSRLYDAPNSSYDYAAKVMDKWHSLEYRPYLLTRELQNE